MIFKNLKNTNGKNLRAGGLNTVYIEVILKIEALGGTRSSRTIIFKNVEKASQRRRGNLNGGGAENIR